MTENSKEWKFDIDTFVDDLTIAVDETNVSDMSKRSKLDRSSIYKITGREQIPGLRAVINIANALGKDVRDYFIVDEGETV